MPTYEFALVSSYRNLRKDFSRNKTRPQDFAFMPTSIRSIFIEDETYDKAKARAGRMKRPGEKFYEEPKKRETTPTR